MIVDINKDFLTEYKDDLWKGFSGRELGTIIVAGGVAAGIVALISGFSGMKPSDAVYIALPAAFPILLLGFFRYQGYLYPIELLKEIAFTQRTRHLHFESQDNVFIGTRKYKIDYTDDKQKKHRRKSSKCR